MIRLRSWGDVWGWGDWWGLGPTSWPGPGTAAVSLLPHSHPSPCSDVCPWRQPQAKKLHPPGLAPSRSSIAAFRTRSIFHP